MRGIVFLLVLLAIVSSVLLVDASKKWRKSMISTNNEGVPIVTPIRTGTLEPTRKVVSAPSVVVSLQGAGSDITSTMIEVDSPTASVPHVTPVAPVAPAVAGATRKKSTASTTGRNNHARDFGDPCVNDTDCSYIACTTATCDVDNTCIYPERLCPPPEDTCIIGGTCNVGLDACVYDVLDCDDYNNCTTDSCEYNATESMNQCKNEPIIDCTPNCIHSLNITIDVVDSLAVNSFFDGSVLEFCQTTNYLGPQSTVILSFDPYVPCNLNRRGTCDSKFGYNDIRIHMCVLDTQNSTAPCNGTEIGYTMNLQGISPSLQWNNTDDAAVFIFDPEPVGHLKGLLVDPGISNLFLVADIWFSDATWGFFGPVPPGSPVLDMDPDCYNGTVDVDQWWYYNDMHGTIEGVNGTDYEGLIITVDRYGPSPQYGNGANNQNGNLGMYATFTWTIVQQPFNPLYNVTEPGSFSTLFFDIDGPCPDPNVYCELMGEPNYDYPDDWTPTLDEVNNTITYCTNFTVDQLISCKSFYDPDFMNGALFNITNTGECVDCAVNYVGTLYETTILPSDCENWPFSCGEIVVRSSCYNISVTIDASGIAEVRFYGGTLDFDVQWLANMWLCGPDAGNLQVVIRTSINQNGNTNTSLCNPLVDLATETGYPLVFVAPLSPDCVLANVSGQSYCYQEWILRTFDGIGIVDFSGFKKLTWEVCVNGVPAGNVEANVDLHARRSGEQSHFDGKATAELDLYLEADFEDDELYNGVQVMTDCDRLYGSICLTNHQHLDILTRSAMICYSTLRDLDPFDPLNPGTTGCNTPGPDVVQVLIYSCDPVMESFIDTEIHDFYFINHVDTTSKCNYFSYKVLAYTTYSQILRVTWCAVENGGQPGDSALIEFYDEFSMGSGDDDDHYHHHDHDFDHHDDHDHTHIFDNFQRHDHHHFHVGCPHNWLFDWNYHRCHGHGHDHGGQECSDDCDHHVHVHTHDDDDDDDFDEDWSPFGVLIFVVFFIGAIFFCFYWHAPIPVVAHPHNVDHVEPPPHHHPHHHHRPHHQQHTQVQEWNMRLSSDIGGTEGDITKTN